MAKKAMEVVIPQIIHEKRCGFVWLSMMLLR